MVSLVAIILLVIPAQGLEINMFRFDKPDSCSQNSSYNSVMLSCVVCPPGSRRVSVENNFYTNGECRCMPGYFTTQDTGYYMGDSRDRQGGLGLQCSKCKHGFVSSEDGRMCLECENGVDPETNKCNSCPEGHIQIERDDAGQLLDKISCVPCSPGTFPSKEGKLCEPCNLYPLLAEHNIYPHCNCVKRSGLCLPNNLDLSDIYIETPSGSIIKYQDREIESNLFKDQMTVSAYMCGRHLNSTSCNLLANLCALTLHDREHPSCSTLKRIADRNNDQTVRRVPSLFLPSGQSSSTTESEAITSSHSLPGRGVAFSNRLNITIARYSIEGHLIAVETAKGNVFHICNISDMIADAAWSFGTRYKKICKVPALALWSMKTEFYDLYYNFPMDQSFPNKDTLYSIFNLVLNSKEQMEEDPKNWVLTTRFFLVDSSASVSGSDKRAKVVRYLEHLEIVITLLDTRKNPLKPGRIHPPITKLRYKEVSLEEAKNNKKVEMTFSVSYRMNMINVEKDVEIAAGVMSALAVLLGAVDAWSWSKRSGKVGIDARTLIKLVVSAAGYLSHIFLAIIFFSSLYWFIFFKQQNFVHTVLPAEDQEAFIKHYLISAFALKLLDIVVLILSQVTVDIFLLDWERPPPRVEKLEKSEELEPPVSVWRTYLVANEWNELQTTRKSKISVQVLIFLVLMKVVGLENLASADAHNRLWTEEDEYMAEHSYVCRFALGVSIWAGISVFQTLFWVGVYAPIVENKLAQFTDICSLANISVFVMSHSHFGYYIHGKSAHGSADTDMEGLLNQLQREADDLCGHRGLQAGSDQQTFSMILPATLRTYYDKVVTPVFKSEAGRETGRLTSTTLQNSVQAYTTMNRFLTRFLQHALKDLDFEVRERNFIESTLDIEFTNTVTEKAVFYTDKGHSFDCLLLYGHEFTLTIWEILVMSFVDLLAQDFLLAAIITYFVSKFVSVLRYMIGRSNLARKTLIDKRFLI